MRLAVDRLRPADAASSPNDTARRLATVPGVTNVETVAADRFRLTADRDVRPDAARAVVAANGSLRRLSVDEPSLEAIYTRYFHDAGQQQQHGVQHAA